MSATLTLTQTGLRLKYVTWEMQGMNDRSVKSKRLHQIIEECVARRQLLYSCIWGQRGNDGLMRLQVEIDYDEHDRQVKLSGDGLPDGVVGEYGAGLHRIDARATPAGQRHGYPHVGKAIDLFVKTAKDRGLHLTWSVCFAKGHEGLYKRFGFGRNPNFRNRTTGAPSTTVVHSAFLELKVSAAVATEPSASADVKRKHSE